MTCHVLSSCRSGGSSYFPLERLLRTQAVNLLYPSFAPRVVSVYFSPGTVLHSDLKPYSNFRTLTTQVKKLNQLLRDMHLTCSTSIKADLRGSSASRRWGNELMYQYIKLGPTLPYLQY